MPVDILATSKSPHVFSCHSNPHKSLAVFFHLQRCYSDGISNKFVLSSTHDLHLFWMSPIDVMTGQMCYVHVKIPKTAKCSQTGGKRKIYAFSWPLLFFTISVSIQIIFWLVWNVSFEFKYTISVVYKLHYLCSNTQKMHYSKHLEISSYIIEISFLPNTYSR